MCQSTGGSPDGSGMSREAHVPFYEGLRVQFPRPTHRFCLSFRDTEDLLAQRGIPVSYETIRQWCRTFGPAHARTLRRHRGRMGDTWYLDELFVNIQGRQQYLWTTRPAPGAPLVYRRGCRPAAGDFAAENLIDHDGPLCETASSWRLLSGGFAPGFSHRPYNTTRRELPLQISTAVRTSPPDPSGLPSSGLEH